MEEIVIGLVAYNAVLTIIVVKMAVSKNRDKELRDALVDQNIFSDISEFDCLTIEDSFYKGKIHSSIRNIYITANENENKIEEMNKSYLEKFCENYICKDN